MSLLLSHIAPGRHLSALGYHYFEVRPGDPLVIDFSGGLYRTVYYWEGERDDDPSVLVKCQMWGVEYVYKPTLANAAFFVGDIVTLLTDAPIEVQVWVFPIDFCSPTTHYYSIAQSFSNRFTLMENVSHLCLFFENPSRATQISAQILSKRVNFSESRIEIWDGGLERISCPKHKCEAMLHSKFFIRVVGAHSGLKIALSGSFKRHDLATVCTRDAVTVWDANQSYTAHLATVEEQFFCDDSLAVRMQYQWTIAWIGAAVLGLCGGVCLWLWWNRANGALTHLPARFRKEAVSRERSMQGGEKNRDFGLS
jgi:hypothetical protein